MSAQADIGLIGLAVMGQNLVLNMNDHGFTVAVYNRTTSKVDAFLANEAKGTNVIGTHSIEELVASLKRPRKVMMMVKAGGAVDAIIEQLLPHLEEGDIIIDGGNSLYTDSTRRTAYLESKGLLFVGTGISDMGISQGDNLAGVGRITQNFLIASHRGVKDHLAYRLAGKTNRPATKYRPVLKRKKCRFVHIGTRIWEAAANSRLQPLGSRGIVLEGRMSKKDYPRAAQN